MLLDDNIDNDVCGVGGSITKNIKIKKSTTTLQHSNREYKY